MGRYVPDEIEAYAERYTTAHWDGFDRLGAETEATRRDHVMMVGAVEGAFLSFLVFMTGNLPLRVPATARTVAAVAPYISTWPRCSRSRARFSLSRAEFWI